MVEDHQLPEGLREAPLRERGGKTFMGGGRLATRSRYVVLAGVASIIIVGGFHYLSQRAIGASEAELTGARALAVEIEEIEKTYWQVRGEERGFLLSAEQRHVDRYQTVSTALTARLDALFANPAAEVVRDHLTTVTEGLVQHGTEFRGVIEAGKGMSPGKPGAVQFIVPKGDEAGPTQLTQDEINRLKATASSTEALMEHEKRSARLDEIFTYMNPSVEALIAFARQRLADAVQADDDSRALAQMVLPTSTGAVILLFMLFSLVILRSVSVPVGSLAVTAVRMAEGDDNIAIPAQANRDELGDLARALGALRGGGGETEDLRDGLAVVKADLRKTESDLEEARADREHMSGSLEQAKLDQEQTGEALKGALAEREQMVQALEQAKSDRERMTQALEQAKADRDQMTQDLQDAQAAQAIALGDMAQARADLEKTALDLEQARRASAAPERETAASTPRSATNRGHDATAENISAISRQVAQSGQILSTVAYEAEQTDALIRGLAGATSRIGDAERLLSTIAGLAAEDGDASALKRIRATTNQANLVVKEVQRMIDRIKATAIEIADASSTHALETTADLLEKSENLRGMLDDLVNRIRGDDRPS